MDETLAASLARLPVSFRDIETASALIAGSVKRTIFDRSRTLSDITGANIWLKFENLQFTATFKERGALNRLSALSPDERQRGVIAASAGNHAQGVAYHAARLSIPATIFVPVGTPTVKIENTRRHGEGDRSRSHARGGRRTRHRAWPQGAFDLHPSVRRSADRRRSGHHRAGNAC
jgi:threonine dehydratase